MDPWLAVSIGLAALAGLLAILLTRRDAALRGIRRSLGAPPSADPAASTARLRQSLDEASAALATERSIRAVLLDQLSSGVIRTDSGLRIVEANSAAHILLDRTPGGLLGRTVMEAFLDTSAETIARAAVDGSPAAGEVRLTDADGPTLIVRGQASTDGGTWLVLDDVSELRRLQRIRTEFIDNLSHELRTPLTTVSLLAETLAREADGPGVVLPPKLRDRIGKIEIETGHLVQMVNELLDLSRIESGGTIRLLEDLDMGQLAAQATERLRLFAERQGVTLEVFADPHLPTVRGDSARLGQVVINLVHNAVKFSPDGGPVTIRAAVRDSDVVTSVEDRGVGIPRAAQTRIFERFYKVDRSRLRAVSGGGTGLGLAIARHVVEQHGGRIWVESGEGRGSTFSFALPIPATRSTPNVAAGR
ncbi:MAG: ATP-binding protein [Candidatus Limnocylindrales bacterium]